jgi:hypothetical protein
MDVRCAEPSPPLPDSRRACNDLPEERLKDEFPLGNAEKNPIWLERTFQLCNQSDFS